MLELFSVAGGLFSVFTFVHFFADWLFQSHFEATNKHKNAKIRARHCLIYTVAFIPILLLMKVSLIAMVVSLVFLFVSHFVIDTYVPVYLWAKYLRKVPSLQKENLGDKSGMQVFAEMWSNPIYPILFIAVDQILHLTFLWPVVLAVMVL